MEDIFISINNNEEVLRIPVPPPQLKLSDPWNNEEYETVSNGTNTLIGQRKLITLTIESFFPIQDYPFNRNKNVYGWEYVSTIKQWRERRVPLRIVVTPNVLNMAVVIDDFQYGEQDGSGDVYYSLMLKEFKFPELEQVSNGT